MAIGERIKYIRNLRGMTQKELGMAIGFDARTADVRIAQYESGTRSPKEKYIEALANALSVQPFALTIPDIDTYYGLIHTLFALEDLYGFKIKSIEDELCLVLDKNNRSYHTIHNKLSHWNDWHEKLNSGTISKEQYDNMRYNYPDYIAINTRKDNGND